MTMMLALGLAASVVCLASFIYLVAKDSSDTREDYEGF